SNTFLFQREAFTGVSQHFTRLACGGSIPPDELRSTFRSQALQRCSGLSASMSREPLATWRRPPSGTAAAHHFEGGSADRKIVERSTGHHSSGTNFAFCGLPQTRSSSSEQPRIISEARMERYHLLRPICSRSSIIRGVGTRPLALRNADFAGE